MPAGFRMGRRRGMLLGAAVASTSMRNSSRRQQNNDSERTKNYINNVCIEYAQTTGATSQQVDALKNKLNNLKF